MKSYTDIEQSKKLAEMLPIESADMIWIAIEDNESFDGAYEALPKGCSLIAKDDEVIPCWSLTALLDVLPYPHLEQNYKGKWYCRTEHVDTTYLWEDDNPIDACVAMIEKLHEQKLL